MSLPSWVPEIETKPAPEPLLAVQAFVNTYEAETGIDQLADEVAAQAWLVDAGLLDPREATTSAPVPPDLQAVRAVRESIRALLVQNGGGPAPDPAALAPLRDLGGGPLLAVLGDDGQVALRPDRDAAWPWVARVLVIVRDAQHDGTWMRLKACRNDECHWAFYDRSHAGRGAWCDMAVCGNRIKNRNLRSRRAAGRSQ